MGSIRSRRILLLGGFLAILAASLAVNVVLSQRGGRFARMEQAALSQPFVGVTAEGQVESGLFTIRETGVSTEPVRLAAEAFLASLDESQRQRAQFEVDGSEWRKWANQHSYPRQGVMFEDLDAAQREAAFALMKAGLSAKGFKRSRDIMRLNYTLGEITSNFEEMDEWLYYFTFLGEPSAEKPWGWQLDGHHLIVNYFVLGDQVVMTPTFMGSEPVIAEAGKYKGLAVMQDELRRGLELIRSLDESQRERAVIATSKDSNNALAEAFKDNLIVDYAGIPGSEMTAAQRETLVALVSEFVGNMAEGHARVRMEEVRKHLDSTYFAWIGDHGEDAVFYYRVHSPVVLIEFDHQRPVFMRHLPRSPTRQHVHSVIRTPNGNDYGKDLLRQHYERGHHAEPEGAVATLR